MIEAGGEHWPSTAERELKARADTFLGFRALADEVNGFRNAKTLREAGFILNMPHQERVQEEEVQTPSCCLGLCVVIVGPVTREHTDGSTCKHCKTYLSICKHHSKGLSSKHSEVSLSDHLITSNLAEAEASAPCRQ